MKKSLQHSNSLLKLDNFGEIMNHDNKPEPVLVQSDSIWLAEHQQLHIDLQPLLNQSGSLILTGWDVGIRWLNVIDGETAVHTDPFAESLFPIEFIDHYLLRPCCHCSHNPAKAKG